MTMSRTKIIKLKPGDLVLLAFFIIIGLTLGYFQIIKPRVDAAGQRLIITIDGVKYRTHEISETGIFKIEESEINMTYRIKNNKVNIIQSNCPLKICVKSKQISRPGEMIICLPNKVVFYIQGKQKREIDAATY